MPPIDPQGFIIFVCYVWKSETPVCVHILRQLKLNGSSEEHSSESINSPLRFFTKQDGEVETEGAPPWGNRSGITRPEGQGLESEPRQGLLMSEARNKSSTGKDGEIEGTCVKSYISFSHHDVTNSAPDIVTARVCVELGVITSRGASGDDDPAIVLCSVDVEPCQRGLLHESDLCLQANSKTHESDLCLQANIKTHETIVDGEKGYLNDSSAPQNSEVSLNTDSKELQPVTDYLRVDFPTQTIVSYDKTGCEPRANLTSDTSQGLDNDIEDSVVDSTNTPIKGRSEPTISHDDNNIDCMMNRISHDLDYLLNRKSPLSKRHSRRGSTFEKDSARTSESNT
uniref:Uncharacterized protein n=1 Tax=Timema cristinae TaxID=61476 RepID=A0A7R9DCP0_TIMCR|nr:unnamed protein product [Timema cristinae]